MQEGLLGCFSLLAQELKEQKGKKCDFRTVEEVVVSWVVASLEVTSGQVRCRARL